MTDEPNNTGAEQENQPTQEPTPETTAVATEEAGEAEGDTKPAAATEEASEAEGEKKPEKLKQDVDISDVGPCKKHIKVTVDRSSIDVLYNDKFSDLVKQAIVPGFRKGKAPRKIIERQFARDVGDQVKGEVLMASLEQLAEDYEIAPLSAPNINPAKIEIPKSGPLVYEFDVEVRPEFDLPDYKGLKLKRPVRTFTEEDISREQRRLLAPYGQLMPKEDGTVAPEDYITVDMTTRYQDKVIGTAKELTLRVDNRLAFKDGVAENFAETVKGAKAGDSRTVHIVMSSNVAAPALAGLTVEAALEIKEVKTVRLPELTHEFLHTFGVHSEEQLREEILALLERRLAYQQRQSARQQILQHFESAAQLDLPQDLLIRQARNVLTRRAMEMREGGMSDEDIQGRLRLMQQDILQSTAASLKEHFVLQKIAEVEKIDISDDEIEAEIDNMAEESDESARRVRARLERDGELETLAALLIERKALDLILDQAEYEDVPLDKPAEEQVAVAEEQAVEGELRDPTQQAEEQAEGESQ